MRHRAAYRLGAVQQTKTDLVIEVFKKAYDKRKPESGLMFHSDQGTQYTAKPLRQLLNSLNIVHSCSKRGNILPYLLRMLFQISEEEEINRRTYSSFKELRLSIFEYIEGYCNSVRSPGTLYMSSPNEKEQIILRMIDFTHFII